MPTYGSFENLADYLTQRCRQNGQSYNSLSEAIGKSHGYIHGVATGGFAPSRKTADVIAKHFDDPPRLVRILADLELPAPGMDKELDELTDIAASFKKKEKGELLEFARFLKQRALTARMN